MRIHRQSFETKDPSSNAFRGQAGQVGVTGWQRGRYPLSQCSPALVPAGSTTVLSEPLIFSKEGPNLDFESKSSLFYILLQVFKKHCAVQQKHMCGQYLTWGTSVRVWLPGRWDYGNFYYAELLTQTIQPTQNPMQASHNYQSDQQFCSWLYTQKS